MQTNLAIDRSFSNTTNENSHVDEKKKDKLSFFPLNQSQDTPSFSINERESPNRSKVILKSMIMAHLKLKQNEQAISESQIDLEASQRLKAIESLLPNECKVMENLEATGKFDLSLIKKRDEELKPYFEQAFLPTSDIGREIHANQQELLNSIEVGLLYFREQGSRIVWEVDSSKTIDAMKQLNSLSKELGVLIPEENIRLMEEEIQWHSQPFSEMFLRCAQRNEAMLFSICMTNEEPVELNPMDEASVECNKAWKNLRLKMSPLSENPDAQLENIQKEIEKFGEAFAKVKEIGLKISEMAALQNVSDLQRVVCQLSTTEPQGWLSIIKNFLFR